MCCCSLVMDWKACMLAWTTVPVSQSSHSMFPTLRCCFVIYFNWTMSPFSVLMAFVEKFSIAPLPQTVPDIQSAVMINWFEEILFLENSVVIFWLGPVLLVGRWPNWQWRAAKKFPGIIDKRHCVALIFFFIQSSNCIALKMCKHFIHFVSPPTLMENYFLFGLFICILMLPISKILLCSV